MPDKKQLRIVISTPYLKGMNELIQNGLESQTEIIKTALRKLFSHYEVNSINDCYAVLADRCA